MCDEARGYFGSALKFIILVDLTVICQTDAENLGVIARLARPRLVGAKGQPLADTLLPALIELRSINLFQPVIHMPISLGCPSCPHECNVSPSLRSS